MKEIFSSSRSSFLAPIEKSDASPLVLLRVSKRFACFFSLCCFCAQSLYAEESEIAQVSSEKNNSAISSNALPIEEASRWALIRSQDVQEDRYTINFNNVSITEYIRFVSKITGKNFIFQDEDLQFAVTIVSEEPITVKNILSALVQTLRIHNLTLLEQDNSFIITASRDVTQMAPVVSAEHMNKKESSPIITRVFRIKNANIASIAAIIRPMTSQAAIVEISPETRQLIVTDIATNIDKIASLLSSIDSPHSPLDIEIFKPKHTPSQTLIDLTRQIITPFAEGNPLIYVPQEDTNSIFIVSTPYLIERSVEVMEDLDRKPKTTEMPLTNEKIVLYTIQSRTPEEIIDAIHQIVKNLETTGTSSYKLVVSLKSVKWIKDSNALLFITDSETEPKVLEIVKALDSVSLVKNFYVYKVQQAGIEQIQRALKDLATSIKKTSQDKELIDAIHSMKYITETNSLIFTGPEEALRKLEDLLPIFDVGIAQFSPSSHYWLYSPQYLTGKELKGALEDINKNLESSGLSDKALIHTLESMKWVPSTNTLLFTGDPPSLEHIQDIIKLIDIPSGSPSKIFLYNPKYISREQIEEALEQLRTKLDTKNLSDKNVAHAIENYTWITESHSFLFKSDPASIDKISTFLNDIDTPNEAEAIAQTFFLYNLTYARGQQVLEYLQTIAKNLPDHDLDQKAVVKTIKSIDFLKETNSLLLKGTHKSVDTVKGLIAQFDTPQAATLSFEKTAFLIYRPIHQTPTNLQAALQQIANDLKASGLIDSNLLESLKSMRYVEITGSLVFTGTADSLEKTKQIIATVDTPFPEQLSLEEISGHTFLMYKVQYLPIDSLVNLLKTISSNLQKLDPVANKDLIRSINSAKEMKETNSILFTGSAVTLEKVHELLRQIDIPTGTEGEVAPTRMVSAYLTYKPLHVSGEELIGIMHDFEENLMQSGVNEPQLFETINNLRYIEKVGYILVSGDQSSVNKVEELLKKFDIPSGEEGLTSLANMETSFLVYKLQYHKGTDIQTALKQIAQDLGNAETGSSKHLITAINSLQWIQITNSLLATGTPEVLTKLKELIKNVDVPLRQVFIEVLIIQTTLTNNQQFGLQWGSKFQYLNKFAGGFGNFPSPNPATPGVSPNIPLAAPLASVNAVRTPVATDIPVPTGSNGFDLGVIGDIILHHGRTFISLASLVNALQQDDDAVVLMNPKIIGQDSQTSTIFVGQNIPFAGSTVTTSGLTQQTATNIEYRDVGVNLIITPTLGTNDIVTLDISNDITAQIANTTTGVNGIQGLQTSHTSLSARVHVPNNHFVALSGMLQDTKSHFKSAIPCLGGLPIIGAAFSENDRLNSKNSVIFFIRPTIIDSFEEYKKLTERQEELFKDSSVLPAVKEGIDYGIDWVKTPENE